MSYKRIIILLLILTATLSACCWPTALHWAVMDKDITKVQTSLDEGVYVDARECDGLTALWIAAGSGNDAIVKILLEAGADVNAKPAIHRGITPLILAAAKGYTSTVIILLEAGANVDAQSTRGETALMETAIEGYADIVQILLYAGANINLQNSESKTALNLAKENRHFEASELIRTAGEKRTTLIDRKTSTSH